MADDDARVKKTSSEQEKRRIGSGSYVRDQAEKEWKIRYPGTQFTNSHDDIVIAAMTLGFQGGRTEKILGCAALVLAAFLPQLNE